MKKEKEVYLLKTTIINALNSFGKIGIENYSPLKANLDDFCILFDIIKERLRYIKSTIELNNPPGNFGNLVYYPFNTLFIGKYDLKIENLNKKME